MLWPPHALSNTRYKIIFQLSDIYILPVLKPTVTEAVSRREEIIFVAQAAFLPIVDVEDGRTVPNNHVTPSAIIRNHLSLGFPTFTSRALFRSLGGVQ